MNGKTVLVIGGTGAMGVYLVPELASMGCKVHVVSLDDVKSEDPDIVYYKANAKDNKYLGELLQNKYDAIVDFMLYSTKEFSDRYEMLLNNTGHYIYLSSYRVYADRMPITEDTPRLLDVSDDKKFLETDDYSLIKARQENILTVSGFNNWTIVRPVITYSKFFKVPLVTLEANTVVYRAQKGLTVFLPEEALPVTAAVSWAGDTAKMFARLILNPATCREAYTQTTAERHTWKEIAEFYREFIGLEYKTVDTKTFLEFFGSTGGATYQLYYDRLCNLYQQKGV